MARRGRHGAVTTPQGIRTGMEDLISEVAAMRTAMGQTADSVSGLMARQRGTPTLPQYGR